MLGEYFRETHNHSFVRLCEEIASNDANPKVRGVAIATLGGCYRNTHDNRISRFLLLIVHDNAQPVNCRIAAYMALYLLRGLIMPPWKGALRRPPVGFAFPQDVDWRFVASFSDGTSLDSLPTVGDSPPFPSA